MEKHHLIDADGSAQKKPRREGSTAAPKYGPIPNEVYQIEKNLVTTSTSSLPERAKESKDAALLRDLAPWTTVPLCIICSQTVVKPKVNVLCGHFACSDCWSRWLT